MKRQKSSNTLLLKELLSKKVQLQNKILCYYSKSVYELVERSVAGEIPLLDVVSDVGAHSMELFKEYQDVCNKVKSLVVPGKVEMVHRICFPGHCYACGKDVTLHDTEHGREGIPGEEQIFWKCPYCKEEVRNIIVCVANEETHITEPVNNKERECVV